MSTQENNKSIGLIKSLVTVVSTIGVGKVVDDLIENALPTEVKLPVKILHKIGAYCLSWVVADWATDKVMEDISAIETTVAAIPEKIAMVKEQLAIEEVEVEETEA